MDDNNSDMHMEACFDDPMADEAWMIDELGREKTATIPFLQKFSVFMT